MVARQSFLYRATVSAIVDWPICCAYLMLGETTTAESLKERALSLKPNQLAVACPASWLYSQFVAEYEGTCIPSPGVPISP